ncbi:calcium-binding protein [Rhodococcus koreensis]|uniref:FMN-binding protein n=1 Tax=Rhodococcus koreensis TaxID=99653 RepID=UPI00367033B5
MVVLVPLAGCSNSDPGSSPSTFSSPTGPARSPYDDDSSTVDYADGTYTAKGIYGGAPSYLTVTVTLSADTITDVTVEPMPENNATSRGYQERFAAAVPDEVIGKSIDEVEVGKLAGASSCGDGFNDAVAKIREQARTSN